MFQIIPKLRLIHSGDNFKDKIKNISLRGYLNKPPVSVTGEFNRVLEEGSIPPLSVDEIANVFCPYRREIYMRRIFKKKGKIHWGRVTGTLVESYIRGFCNQINKNKKGFNRIKSYESLVKKSTDFMESFKRQNKKCLQKLSKIKSSPEEDENLLVETLDYAMRNELVMLRSIFLFSDSLTKKLFLQKIKISPKAKILGISSPSTPDFVIPEISAIGDIKTGREFKEFFPLTAAGYALAYENEHGMGNDINFGLIYFFPTRQKYISFANVYIFLIDDKLRSYFLTKRDEAFLMLKKAKDKINPEEPLFADESKYCHDCKFKDDCCTLKKEKRKKK